MFFGSWSAHVGLRRIRVLSYTTGPIDETSDFLTTIVINAPGRFKRMLRTHRPSSITLFRTPSPTQNPDGSTLDSEMEAHRPFAIERSHETMVLIYVRSTTPRARNGCRTRSG